MEDSMVVEEEGEEEDFKKQNVHDSLIMIVIAQLIVYFILYMIRITLIYITSSFFIQGPFLST